MSARELVPGDVVVLEAGDAVPADCRLVEAQEAAVNNAALTGESVPVARVAQAVPPGPSLEARNCVWMGTDLVAGTGKAVVLATGTGTEFGRIFRLTAAAPRRKTPLQRQVAVMARRVAGLALVSGAVVFAVRAPSGQPFVDTFVFSLTSPSSYRSSPRPSPVSHSCRSQPCRSWPSTSARTYCPLWRSARNRWSPTS
ncbi:hypothetical protein [Streptomyces sp. NPDC007205]|uniref:P-type ATPase n=1 Tax=Streptomyces sp. NPDC007205 TaxID=3154316 RepID=UPI00340C4886